MNERKMKMSQKNLVRQRDEARAELERVKLTVGGLTSSMEALVEARVAEDHEARLKAEAERDAVLANMEARIAERLGEKAQELSSLHEELAAEKVVSAALSTRVRELDKLLQMQAEAIAQSAMSISSQEKELASLKMVDAKALRKRIHDKTEQIEALEKTVRDYARTYRRLIANGHRTALKVALDEENASARLETIESKAG